MARGKRGGTRTDAQDSVGDSGDSPPDVAPGQPYGQRAATEAQVAAAPMYDAASGAPSSRPAPSGGLPLAPLPDAFGPTRRPNEPLTAGQPAPGDYYDPVQVLKAIWRAYPSPVIAGLIGDDF